MKESNNNKTVLLGVLSAETITYLSQRRVTLINNIVRGIVGRENNIFVMKESNNNKTILLGALSVETITYLSQRRVTIIKQYC